MSNCRCLIVGVSLEHYFWPACSKSNLSALWVFLAFLYRTEPGMFFMEFQIDPWCAFCFVEVFGVGIYSVMVSYKQSSMRTNSHQQSRISTSSAIHNKSFILSCNFVQFIRIQTHTWWTGIPLMAGNRYASANCVQLWLDTSGTPEMCLTGDGRLVKYKPEYCFHLSSRQLNCYARIKTPRIHHRLAYWHSLVV